MKIAIKLSLLIALFLVGCKGNNESSKKVINTASYSSFGDKINAEGAIDSKAMFKQFNNLKAGDTIAVKFASKVNSVCKKKGCWMKLDLADGKESLVRFKDYGFFVPLNSENNDVIVQGKAFMTTISVSELQHFAKDAGKSDEEIAQIKEPKVTYSFEATGVLMNTK